MRNEVIAVSIYLTFKMIKGYFSMSETKEYTHEAITEKLLRDYFTEFGFNYDIEKMKKLPEADMFEVIVVSMNFFNRENPTCYIDMKKDKMHDKKKAVICMRFYLDLVDITTSFDEKKQLKFDEVYEEKYSRETDDIIDRM